MHNSPSGGSSPVRLVTVLASPSSAIATSSTPSSSSSSSSSQSPASTLEVGGGWGYRLRCVRVQHQLTRMIDGIEESGVRRPSVRRRLEADLLTLEGHVDPHTRALTERLDRFSRALYGSSDDAKAARAVAVPLLLARSQETREVFPSQALTAMRQVSGVPRHVFDNLCSRTLAALEVRANPPHLAYVLSQLTPEALAPGGNAALVSMGRLLENLVGALATPRLSEAHARQLLDFVLQPQARPAAWLARALHGLYLGYLQHRATWPQEVPIHAQMVGTVRQMSLAQVEALGRVGPPLDPMFTRVLPRALGPQGVGVYARGVMHRIAQMSRQAQVAAQWMMSLPAQDDEAAARYAALLGMRDLVYHALHTAPAATFAIACVLAREIGEARAKDLWNQAVDVSVQAPLPQQAEAFGRGVRLALTPLKVMGEPGLPLPDKLALLCLLDALVKVPLSARGWMQVAALHGIDAYQADRFVAPRGQAFIRQVFELERDDAMAALQATYAKAGAQVADGKASKPVGFADHVPQVAQQLTALLMSFDAYERRSEAGGAVQQEFLKTQRAWVDALGHASGPLADVRLMLRERLALMEAPAHQRVEPPASSRPARESKSDPDGDSGDEEA